LRRFLPTGIVASIAIIVMCALAKVPTYHVAPAFLIPILWAPVFLRRWLHLHPVHYVLFALAVLLHTSGAFGFYQRSNLPLSFDIYVHFYFAFAGTFIVERLIGHHVPALGPWARRATTVLFMMGFGAIHEIGEYMSYLVLGEAKGMLKPSTSYFFDTQRDLTNNLLGTITALIAIAIVRQMRSSTRSMEILNQGV
jgi:uncharacterized membrane protein YjdF